MDHPHPGRLLVRVSSVSRYSSQNDQLDFKRNK